MITANHRPWFQALFQYYLNYRIRKSFHTTKIIGSFPEKNLPVLVIANHISWWDGFWLLLVTQKTMQRKFHIMMLEDQLQKHRFLRKLGAFSIRKKHRSALQSLDYAAKLLKDPQNLVVYFPQGEIRSQHIQSFDYQHGWTRLLQKISNPVQLLFVANVLDYFSHAKPTLYQYIYSPGLVSDFEELQIREQYNFFYENSIRQQKSL